MNTFKTLAAMILFTALFMFSAQTSQAQSANDNALIGKARAELSQCLATNYGDMEITGSAYPTGNICPDGSEEKNVVFYGQARCPGNEPCYRRAIILGYVFFDCDGNVTGSTCGVSSY